MWTAAPEGHEHSEVINFDINATFLKLLTAEKTKFASGRLRCWYFPLSQEEDPVTLWSLGKVSYARVGVWD